MKWIKFPTVLVLMTLPLGCAKAPEFTKDDYELMQLHSRQNHEMAQAILKQRAASGPANVVAEGVPPLSFLSTKAGRVSVSNLSTDTKIHTSDIPDAPMGFIIAVNPEKKAVTLGSSDGKDVMVLASPIDPSHRFRITFDPAPPATQPAVAEGTK